MSSGVYGAIMALKEMEKREAALRKFDALTPEEKVKSGREILRKIIVIQDEPEIASGANFIVGLFIGLLIGYFIFG